MWTASYELQVGPDTERYLGDCMRHLATSHWANARRHFRYCGSGAWLMSRGPMPRNRPTGFGHESRMGNSRSHAEEWR